MNTSLIVFVCSTYADLSNEREAVLDAIRQERHTVATFQDGNDIAVQVAADLSHTISGLEETARAREEARRKSPIPLMDELSELVKEALKAGLTESALLSALRRSVSHVTSEMQRAGPSVFFSYASADRDVVRQVADGLSNSGLRVWFGESSLKPGAEWVREIERGLDSADFIIFFISQHSVQAGWAQKELQIALHRQVSGEHGAVLLPVLLEQAEVPPLLRQIQWLDMTDGNVAHAVNKLVDLVRHYRSSPNISQIAKPSERGMKFSKSKLISILDEERGVVGTSAKRLGITPKRLYQLLKHYNIQARQFR